VTGDAFVRCPWMRLGLSTGTNARTVRICGRCRTAGPLSGTCICREWRN